MGNRFYDLATKQIIWEIPTVKGDRLKTPTIWDARKAGDKWGASVTTITGILDKGEGIENWLVGIHLDACEGLHEVLAKDPAGFKAAVRHKAKKIREAPMARGKAVHQAYEDYWRYQLDNDYTVRSVPKEIRPYVIALDLFAEEHKMKPLLLEQVLTNKEVGYAGTMDFYGEFEGEKMVTDYKTQNVKERPFYDIKFPLQLAAYAHASAEVTKDAIPTKCVSIIVDTSRHTTYNCSDNLPIISYNVYDDIQYDYETFKLLAQVYFRVNKWQR